ncbi:PIN domain-containing protein [Candidatus Marinarcus aquaticus]|uniref:DUF4411 family protein n=1 Tax=Candidatus Marinarcus aquaticus TaxID=2044504 RepID=A0A4Q0XWP4_9BACT|nr:PIN domain-containing protein [Candidatus Marinarcus aquaticus]RXJ60689.1 hypothetical protein CRV04_01365 [Candidatus Marinarcus aquaticus]
MMLYIFDSGPLIDLFKHYKPEIFPTLWEKFDKLIEEDNLISVKEVYNEISNSTDALGDWSKNNKHLFFQPDIEEYNIILEIFQVKHFQHIIRKQEILEGKPVADPFVIAKAKYLNACVVTTEKYSENGAKVPNICEHFNVKCMNLTHFMKEEKWIF